MVRANRLNDETPLAQNLAKILHQSCSEAVEEARHMSADDRAELAVFCYSRAHLRDKGLAMAALCAPEVLALKSSNEIAANILAQAAAFAQVTPNRVSLHYPRVSLAYGHHV
ncbi:MAG: hypothetical protein JWL93_1382 [Hyphomicrobiales bacterium]|jgi:hypothetical protein|nr:hypothetical protein [Hyphomicrobiales bacterium]